MDPDLVSRGGHFVHILNVQYHHNGTYQCYGFNSLLDNKPFVSEVNVIVGELKELFVGHWPCGFYVSLNEIIHLYCTKHCMPDPTYLMKCSGNFIDFLLVYMCITIS